MKSQIYPTRVNLKELPDDGEDFLFSRSTGELNATLRDLIQDHDYHASIQLRPMGNAYEILGSITATMDLLCARCGRDMSLPINDNFQELIVVMAQKPKGGHSGHTGTQDGPFCVYLDSYRFNLAEFIHEHIAASEPYTPLCGRTDCEEHFSKHQSSETDPQILAPAPPFAALKDLKLKN